ncbi:MAG: methionyl-tRNA formyltransferase [Deltaproteobacteria bacterium RIFCSPLOWO2_02_FULL_46_8]|nr:MAG: methionyl-tRNA formyltransferase [Deltaproteobacteria bacterium RIFCSPLOWO2_02_FULL_46_8]
MKILFFGSDTFAIPSLRILHASSSHKIIGVVTQPDKPAGRGREITPCPIADLAKELDLPLLQPAKIQEESVIQELLNLKADVLAVVAYGKFLPQSLIDKTRYKAVNLHPSLLPKYRGASPIQTAILNGDAKTGVTTMMVSSEMDAGDLYLQCETDIDPVETAEGLEARLAEAGAHLILKTLEGLEKKTLKSTPQDPKKIILTHKITKEDGQINWNESAETLYNKLRAYTPWPGLFCHVNEKILKIFEAAPMENNSKEKPGTVLDNKDGLIIRCNKSALCLLEVQLEGKKRMGVAEFLKGHPLIIGTQLK